MNYLLKSSRRRSKYRKPFTIVAIFIGVILILSFFFPRLFPGIAHAFAVPVWKTKDVVTNTLSAPISYLKSKSRLSKENDRLSARVAELEIEAQIASVLLEENLVIKEILGRDENSQRTLVRVLARPPQSIFGTLVIDSREDIGKKVIAGNSVLLGEVAESLPGTSVVALYSRGDKLTEVTLNKSKTVGEASGRGGGNFVLEVPKDVDVELGEKVVSTQDDNYIVGVVEQVENNEASTFKQVFFRVPLNISSLEWVEVIQ